MTSKILITGAAGYIGGSLVGHFRARQSALINIEDIIVVVRSEEQTKSLSEQGIQVLQVDLSDEKAVIEAVQRHNINVIIHCASGLDSRLALILIKALGKRREVSEATTYFFHTSGGGAFSEKGSWPHGDIRDTDRVFGLVKQVADSNPLRQTDVMVTEQAKAHGVKSFIVVPPLVYGRGGGEWNKLSVCVPRYVKAGISQKTVYKFAENVSMPAVHVSDLMTLYTLLVEKVLQEEELLSGEEGYYFAVGHTFHWWEALDRLAAVLHARGLVADPTLQVWPNDEMAAEALGGLPISFMHMIWNSSTAIIPARKDALGWQPAWNTEEKFLQSMDDEVQAVEELDRVRSSIFDSLNTASEK